MPYKELTGKKFWHLTAIERVGKDRNGKTLWRCICECGNEKDIPTGSLLSGNSKSCGCAKFCALQTHVAQKKINAFGMYHARARTSWRHMIDRCQNPLNKHYATYGGRGVSVCARWGDLKAFVEDMGDPPDGMTLDRINANGNYEPGNCRWATRIEQSQNRRTSKRWHVSGKVFASVTDAAANHGVQPSTIIGWCDGYRVRGKSYPPRDGCWSEMAYQEPA